MNTSQSHPSTKSNDPYFYLWHLAALGVINVQLPSLKEAKKKSKKKSSVHDHCPEITDTLWDRLCAFKGSGSKSRVALIDVGSSQEHPNLKGQVSAEDSIDLAAHPYGAKMNSLRLSDANRVAGETATRFFSELDISGLNLPGVDDKDRKFFESYVENLINASGVIRSFGEIEERFSSHGTAIAGLIVGKPETVPEEEKLCLLTESKKRHDRQILPYFGVDPFSSLISIRTSFDNDPFQFLTALLYAWMKKADVIVLPRGLPDPIESPVEGRNDLLASPESWEDREKLDLYERIKDLKKRSPLPDPKAPLMSATEIRVWRIVKQLILEISKSIPIVCAAGNEGESQMIYPANLAERDNGIIAVGAVTAEGYRSGYSNYGDGLTLVAPSDDMEVHNRYQVRVDMNSPEAKEGLIPVAKTAMEVPLSYLGLLSTDLPGQYGYDGDGGGGSWPGEDDSDKERPSDNGYYTMFGGTSGATALVGGVIALLRRAERVRDPKGRNLRDGIEMKELLQKTACTNTSVFPGGSKLSRDRMNSTDEDANPEKYFFGAGLVDAKAALGIVLPEAIKP